MPTRISSFRETPEKKEGPFKRFAKFCAKSVFLLLCSAGSAWMLWASFPKKSYAWLAWLALAPFVWGVTKIRHYTAAFFYGWLTGFLFHAAALYWIYYTCVHGGGLSTDLAAAAWLGLSALVSLPFAVFGASCGALKKLGVFFPFLAACGWVSLEWLHEMIAFYGIGFPWLMLGYTQWNLPQTLQLASLAGFYGVSFAVAFTGISVGWGFALRDLKKGMGHILLAGLAFTGAYFGGDYLLAQGRRVTANRPVMHALLMQPDIDQYKKWDNAFTAEINDVLLQMGYRQGTDTDLTVWPESVLPDEFASAQYTNMFTSFAQDSGAYQLVGSNAVRGGKDYVSAFLVSPEDYEKPQEYDKVKLVPFGEFIPLEKWVRRFFPQADVLGALGAFTAGAQDQPLLKVWTMPLGTTICFESVFPQLWRRQRREGAQVMVNITNDAWYFNTAAPYQHLAINVVRAVETGRPVLRAANTGISAYIDPQGRLVRTTGLFTRETLAADVPVWYTNAQNLYTTWGDWLAWLCAVFFFTMLFSTLAFSDD